MQDQQIIQIIENLKGRKNYEEKKALKLGFKSLYDYFEDKILRTEVNLYEGKTFYAKYGNLPLYLILSVIFIVIFILKRKKELY